MRTEKQYTPFKALEALLLLTAREINTLTDDGKLGALDSRRMHQDGGGCIDRDPLKRIRGWAMISLRVARGGLIVEEQRVRHRNAKPKVVPKVDKW
jgi:hypothetical protein